MILCVCSLKPCVPIPICFIFPCYLTTWLIYLTLNQFMPNIYYTLAYWNMDQFLWYSVSVCKTTAYSVDGTDFRFSTKYVTYMSLCTKIINLSVKRTVFIFLTLLPRMGNKVIWWQNNFLIPGWIMKLKFFMNFPLRLQLADIWITFSYFSF